MTTYQTHATSAEGKSTADSFRKESARFRARTRNKIHSLLLEEFAKFSADLPSAKSRIHEITGINKSVITRILAGPKNLTLDTISDFLLAMGSRLEPASAGAHAVGKSNYVHPTSTLGAPHIDRPIAPPTGTSGKSSSIEVRTSEFPAPTPTRNKVMEAA